MAERYPTTLKLFKAWAKAMEEGATVDRPNYGKTLSGSTRKRGLTGSRRLRRRRTHPRRMRKKED